MYLTLHKPYRRSCISGFFSKYFRIIELAEYHGDQEICLWQRIWELCGLVIESDNVPKQEFLTSTKSCWILEEGFFRSLSGAFPFFVSILDTCDLHFWVFTQESDCRISFCGILVSDFWWSWFGQKVHNKVFLSNLPNWIFIRS